VTIATTTATTTVPATATSSCPLITSYLKFGANNDRSQVASLQAFLKDSQNLSVDVNGIFDQKTLDAVKAFQSKYMSQTMGPWGATQSSGYVYITTTKKINEIACNSPLTLNPSELAIIDSYKAQQNNATASATSTVGAVGAVGPIVPNLNASTTPLIGQVQNANGTANTASVVNASILQRLWGFIKNLF
jgi:peptidoglycan hydrolase-like protein with peptidoglycan-binding domain